MKSRVFFIFLAASSLVAAEPTAPMVNQTGVLPVRLHGPVDMKFAVVEAPDVVQAAATATVTPGRRLLAVSITEPGFGYDLAPAVRISAPNARAPVVTLWSNDGTSVAGSMPASATTLNHSYGTYPALLGYTGLPNMASLSREVLAHVDARVRVWYKGATGF